MIRPNKFNRLASLAIIPMMAITIVMATRSLDRTGEGRELKGEGVLVVAGLRDEQLTFFDFGSGERTKISLPGPPHELALAGGYLYATLGRGNALVEVEPRQHRIRNAVPYSGLPNGLAVDGSNLLVTLDGENALVTVNRDTLDEISRSPTGDTPHNVAVADGVAYVTDTRDNRVRAVGGGRPDRTEATAALPEGIGIVGGYVVTTDAGGRALSVFRRGTLEPAGRIEVPGRPVRVVALDDHRVVAALQSSGELAVVDVATGRIERIVSTGPLPDGLCISPSGAYVGVATNGDGSVRVYRLRDWKLITTQAAGEGPGACAWVPRAGA